MDFIEADLHVGGDLVVGGELKPRRARDEILIQDDLAVYGVPWESLRVHDALATNLPATPASDDLALIGNTFGTDAPYVSAGDLKAAGATTRRLRFATRLPVEYTAAETIKVRIACGMKTTVADTSCTVDVEVYKSNRDGTKTGSDLCSTAAQSMNSTTFANKDFTIDASGLAPGDELDVRVSIACNDAATVTAVTPAIGAMELLLDVCG
jgi:hypothetical protein